MYDDIQDWKKVVKKASSSGFFLEIQSDKKFYGMYFRQNYSMALSFKYVIDHSLAGPDRHVAQTLREFRLASLLLPAKYEARTNALSRVWHPLHVRLSWAALRCSRITFLVLPEHVQI